MIAPAPAAKKKRYVDWTGTFQVLRDGVLVDTVTVSKRWTLFGPLYGSSVQDRVFAGSAGDYVLHLALRVLAPGEQVRLWFEGCEERGWRVKALGRAPWETREESADD